MTAWEETVTYRLATARPPMTHWLSTHADHTGSTDWMQWSINKWDMNLGEYDRAHDGSTKGRMEADITKAHYNFKEQIKISWKRQLTLRTFQKQLYGDLPL